MGRAKVKGSGTRQSPWVLKTPPGTSEFEAFREAWARSPKNPVGGWYGLKRGLRGRFGMYVPPVMEAVGLAEVEHLPKNNRMRARWVPSQVFSVSAVKNLLEQGAQLVDVLGEDEFAHDHLPGAINIPLKRLDEKTVAGLDRERPVLVYCNDFGWDLSPRAAWRLETLGFKNVIDYVPGKLAWFEENQPREGKAVEETWIGDVADPEVPTCGLKDRVGDVRGRTVGWDTCVVVGPERVVLGLLRKAELEGDPNATAERVMRSGPKTFRPNVTLEELLKSMREHDIQTNSLVTTGEGRLLGVISRADAEATLAHDQT